MRSLLSFIIISVFISLNANAQQGLIKLYNGDSTEVYITDIDSLKLYTADTNYAIADIKEVIFHKERGKDIHLYYELEAAGVKVRFDEQITFPEIDPTQIKLQQDPLSQLKSSLNEYRKTHQIGSGLQLAGVLLGTTGVLFNSDILTGLGLGVLAGGLIYEISASRHLSHLEY